MSSKGDASMIIGISMGQEIRLIQGQVSLNLLYWKKNLQTDICGRGGGGGRLTRKQLTSRPDHLWPELWEKMGENAKLKEKQKWSHEKPPLDNARKLRGIYFIDTEDKEFKETIKNARKKLETPVAPAMPCKIIKNSKNCGNGASAKLSGRDHHEFREPTPRRERPVGSEDLSGELQGETEGPQTTETKNDAEARIRLLVDSRWLHLSSSHWTSSSTPSAERRNIPYSTEIHWCNKVHSHKSGRVARKNYQRLLECGRESKFITFLERNQGYVWSKGRLTKNLATTRPENVWPEVRTKSGKAAQKKEKQEWANEKPKLDNARRLRSI